MILLKILPWFGSVFYFDYLKANSKNKIKMDWKYYKDYDHMTVFQPAVKDGLMFLWNETPY